LKFDFYRLKYSESSNNILLRNMKFENDVFIKNNKKPKNYNAKNFNLFKKC